MTEQVKLESICPSCGKTDKLLWPDGCKNTWHIEGCGAMSEIRRYDVRSKYVDHSDCEWEYEASDSGSIVFADNALTALRQRDERIAVLEQQLNEKESCIRKICEALGGNKEIPPWARITTLRQQVERLSAPVTDAEWLRLCAGDADYIQRSDIENLMAARKGAA